MNHFCLSVMNILIILTFFTMMNLHCNETFPWMFKGSYNAILNIIILCIWCKRISWHDFMFKKHIIFQILYIIVGPLCPASNTSFSTKSLLQTSAVCSDWPTDPVQCVVIGRTPQAQVGNVTPFSIITSLNMFLCGSVVEHCVSCAKGCRFDSQGTMKMY